jgi:hypothetical protein
MIIGQLPRFVVKVSIMNRKIGALLLISTVAVGLTLGLASVGPAAADKGGCPNDAAGNGASHANAKSAHGYEKLAARGCSTVDPIPDVTPTPVPADEADIEVVGVSVRTPTALSLDGQFVVRVGASLLNAGPADTALVDTTFGFDVPSACSVSPEYPLTVEDSSLPEGVGVYISRGWIVTCLEPGVHQVTANVTVAMDTAQSMSDPDPSNNTGSATVTLLVGS